MARPVKSPAMRARTIELLDKGHSYASARRELGNEGFVPPSVGWISGVRKAQKAAASAPAAAPLEPAPATAPPADVAEAALAMLAEAAEADPEDAQLLPVLHGLLGSAKRAQATCDKDGNLDGLVKAGRLTTTVAALIAKLTPPQPASVEDAPDYVQAAADVRRKCHEMLDSALKRAAK